MAAEENKHIIRLDAGTVLTVLAGLSFYLQCMVLSLVGPSGSRVDHAGLNKDVFLAILLTTLVLASASCLVRFNRRKTGGGAIPWIPIGLCAVCAAMLVISVFNGFSI